jgi:hypothetical protein
MNPFTFPNQTHDSLKALNSLVIHNLINKRTLQFANDLYRAQDYFALTKRVDVYV